MKGLAQCFHSLCVQCPHPPMRSGYVETHCAAAYSLWMLTENHGEYASAQCSLTENDGEHASAECASSTY